MRRHSIAEEIYENETKINFGVPDSVRSMGDRTPNPALGSSIQLFESESSTEEEKRRLGIRGWLVFICIVILAIMDSFNATVLIPALPDLANKFGKPLASTFWVNTVYLLFGTTSQLYFTMISEVFSHGPVWIIAVVLATVGTGICCGSMSLIELIVGRMIQGIGSGGAMSLCSVLMTESAPKAIHSRYSCYILLTRMCGAILGPIVGGLFVDNAEWRWAFYFNFIFCALGLLAIPFAVDLRASKYFLSRKEQVLDWLGVAMAFLGLGSILVGLSWGGSLYRWGQWQTVVPIAVGAVVLLALVLYRTKWAAHPQFGRVFRSKMMTMTHLGCFLHGFVFFAHLQFFPLYFISAHYMSVSLSGISLLALIGFAIAPTAVVGVILARELRCTQWTISGGWILTVLASGCSILLDHTTPTVAWVFLLFTAGLGHGLLLSSYNVRVQNLPKDEDGDSSPSILPTTMSYYIRAWGMAAAVPVGGVVLFNFFGYRLESVGMNRELVTTANGYLLLMKDVSMTVEQRDAVTFATVAAFQVLWGVITGVAGLGGISSAFLWRKYQ
ncbi:Major facilitator superfamily domain general substrate transporter [Penicillium paradoxum]|uniref:Major facilitator superfamily domain general substrate transporter n=1 Tax=Penicillium paradoxum TaxID=176176 RepID=UPI002548C9EC|nr:Major facilitator superfamily domain general substrate transporter [Penicillium paradoxum]KAJ5782313.1 Major facilitator superfamily domain general substrate transporter [Penicillium paradoxum]